MGQKKPFRTWVIKKLRNLGQYSGLMENCIAINTLRSVLRLSSAVIGREVWPLRILSKYLENDINGECK